MATKNDVVRGIPIPEYDNMFINGLPPIQTTKQLQAIFERPPLLGDLDRLRPREERMHTVLRLLRFSQPTVAQRELGRRIEQMIRQGYVGRDPISSEWTRLSEACGLREDAVKTSRSTTAVTPEDALAGLTPVSDTSMSTTLVGPPGTGKTHAVRNMLATYKQVIYHTAPFTLPQIVWLRVECPPNGSLVGLCRFFFEAVDTALQYAGIASNLTRQYKNMSLPVMLTGMARTANVHGIGLLVIDEIQHVKVKQTEGRDLLNFLVTLRNSIGIPLLLVGTMAAMTVVQRTFRDARRADGLGSIIFDRMGTAVPSAAEPASDPGSPPVEAQDLTSADAPRKAQSMPVMPNYGTDFESFVRRMWRWQYTRDLTELSVPLLNEFYDQTQGVIDLVVKLFVLVQMELINGRYPEEVITPALVREVASRSFNAVKPYIRALRDNDQKAIAQFEDLVNLNEWFVNFVSAVDLEELNLKDDEQERGPVLPPMTVGGGIDGPLADALMEGLEIPVKHRSAMLARHAALAQAGNVAELLAAFRKDKQVHDAHEPVESKRKKVPPTENDFRTRLSGVKDAKDVAGLVDAPDLASALD